MPAWDMDVSYFYAVLYRWRSLTVLQGILPNFSRSNFRINSVSEKVRQPNE
jgi:hypothetical protein